MIGNLNTLDKMLKDVTKAIKSAEKSGDVKNKMNLMMIKRDLNQLISRVKEYYASVGV